MKEFVIDTREFDPPAPMQMAISELQNIIPGESFLHQIHRMEPTGVINRLSSMGMDFYMKREGDDYHIYYFYKEDRDKVLKEIDV
ncbi:MAG: hypothetical protein GXO31_00390 [Epsilonproteobacteria bacterium]|nr:hypothetical protein [Campylobacterota bacterium]